MTDRIPFNITVRASLLQLWARLPSIVRGVVIGFIILTVGQIPLGALLLANAKLSPTIPWFLPIVLVWLWFFFQYLNGKGFPQATAQSRRQNLRARPLGGKVWFWSLVAGGLGTICMMSLALLTTRVAHVSQESLNPAFNIFAFSPLMQFSVFLAISATAGVVEEAAFRGYMLSEIQHRHGWIVAIGIVGVMFFAVHLSHAYASLAFLPFFLLYSALHGLLVYLTRSILPSIILHWFSDFTLLPIQYGVIGSQWNLSIMDCVVTSLIFGIVAVPAFSRLARVARNENLADETAVG